MTEAAIAPLRDFIAYLRHPRLIAPSGLRAAGAWRVWGVLLVLYLGVLLGVVGPAMKLWQAAFALPAPDAFGKVSHAALVPLVVLAAPLGEEVFFRGWLMGRPRALWLMLWGMVACALLAALTVHLAEMAAGLGVLGAGVAAIAGWWRLRRYEAAPGWYAAAFPVIWYLVVVLFALSHLGNYPRFSWALVPMVLPQLWAGLVLGYMRMRLGLPASMLAHGLANAIAAALILALPAAQG